MYSEKPSFPPSTLRGWLFFTAAAGIPTVFLVTCCFVIEVWGKSNSWEDLFIWIGAHWLAGINYLLQAAWILTGAYAGLSLYIRLHRQKMRKEVTCKAAGYLVGILIILAGYVPLNWAFRALPTMAARAIALEEARDRN